MADKNYYNDTPTVKEQYQYSSNLSARIALHARFSVTTRDFHEWLFEHYPLRDHARVLEIGCGTGQLWTKNRGRIPATWQVVLSDFSLGMVETARATEVPACFVQSDAQAIPFSSSYFDVVLANHMLSHVPNLDHALSEIRRVLKQGGKLYAATNGAEHLRELDELLLDVLGQSSLHFELPFNLENGAQKLAQHFGRVEHFDHEKGRNYLAVTEIEPLVAYIKSTRMEKELLTPEREQRLRQIVKERIEHEGSFRISRSVGLFEASAS
ncbi:MAG: hypothetical protein A2Z03_03310 [Chloroflexi bacterium RBG_16_56_8]|nr:MAG: hypothetical protein A2Z03_03310 [Chloroflexi bacterium RBG_16_56_8]